MFKQLLKTIALGLASGMACAAGTWAWKNCAEEKANKTKQEYDEFKKSRLQQTEENQAT